MKVDFSMSMIYNEKCLWNIGIGQNYLRMLSYEKTVGGKGMSPYDPQELLLCGKVGKNNRVTERKNRPLACLMRDGEQMTFADRKELYESKGITGNKKTF